MKSRQKIAALLRRERQWFISFAAVAALLIVVSGFMMSNLVLYRVKYGGMVQPVVMFRRDAQEAMALAGFDGEDFAAVSQTDMGRKSVLLEVKKTFLVDIEVDGRTLRHQTVEATAQQVLSDAGVTLGEHDEVTPAREEWVQEGARIQVTRVRIEPQERSQAIAFETYRRTTPELLAGESRVLQEGKPGERRIVEQVTWRDGRESERVELSRTVVRQPQPEIVEVGTGGAITTRKGTERYRQKLTVTATAYTAGVGCGTRTASGTACRVGAIAVDPSVIPLGTRMYITSEDGESWIYGYAVAEDTGGAIRGNKIDLYFDSEQECINFGRRKAVVYVLA